LDEALERTGLFFTRYMDDVIVLAPTRWRLRRAVKIVNEVLTGLRLEKAVWVGWSAPGSVASRLLGEGDVTFEGDLAGERGNDGVGEDVQSGAWGDLL